MREDSDLIEAWRGGDRDAGAALIERHYDAIARFFATKASDRAEDLVQRTFLACAESLHSYRGDGSFRGFLFGIARNMLYGEIRRRVRQGAGDPDFNLSSIVDLAPGVATQAAQRAEQRLLVQALQRIPIELQILLELYYWEQMSVGELAQVLEIPAGTAKSRLFRARGLLRDAMEQVPKTPEEQRTVRALLAEWALDVKGHLEGEPE